METVETPQDLSLGNGDHTNKLLPVRISAQYWHIVTNMLFFIFSGNPS
jgi:hypothetical protein